MHARAHYTTNYIPDKDLTVTESKPGCQQNDSMIYTENVISSTSLGATVVVTQIGNTKCNRLIDAGATRSCVSEVYYHTLMSQI